MDEDLANPSNGRKGKEPTTSCLENNLTLTLDGLHRQVDTAATIRVDWAHMKGDPAFTFGNPEEQVIIVNRILRAASVAKEKIVRLASSYLLANKWYAAQVDSARLSEWSQVQQKTADISEVMPMANEEAKRLSTLIKEIENELQKAEKNVYEAKFHDKTELYKRVAYTLQNRLQEQQQDIHALTLQVRELESKAQAKKTDNGEMTDTMENTTASKQMQLTGLQVQVECETRRVQQVYSGCDDKFEQDHGGQKERSDFERETEECHQRHVSPYHQQVYDDYYHESRRKSTEGPISDPDYFEQMIAEVKTYSEDEPEPMDEDHDLVLENISSDEGDARDNNEEINDETWRRRRLREDLLQMENVLQNFPFRKIGESSRGVESWVKCAFCRRVGQHCSDSSSEVTYGDERYNIVRHGGLCKHCLDQCPPDKCKFKPRRCWYCERIRGIIAEDIMPDDGGHHRALCNVPNARNTLRRRIEDIRRQLNG